MHPVVKFARSLAVGLCWSALAAAAAAAQPSAAQSPAAPDPAQAALEALRGRPWYPAFKAALAETNMLARDRIDSGFADLFSENEALAEATRRIDAGRRDGRPVTAGAVHDAIELGAASLMARAGCFAGLLQRQEFTPQVAALATLRVNGQLPEPVRGAVKDFAQGPCGAPQAAGRSFDPRRALENGKRLFSNAVTTMPALVKYLDERGLLKSDGGEKQEAQARAAVEAGFRRFDGLYDGHAELLKSYAGLFADYCPTDQRFCSLRDMLGHWRQTDAYCQDVARYAATYYMDTSRIGYLTGAQNDGLNRAWEAYHLAFAPACLTLTKRLDLAAAVARRLDVVAPLFSVDSNPLGDKGVARIRDELRAAQAEADVAAGAEARFKAYRAAAAPDARVASASAETPAAAYAGPPLPPTPGDDELRVTGTAQSERLLQLDGLTIRDLQERLTAIGSALTLSGSLNNSTRAAIRSWQGAVGLEPTGFLTRPQIDLLRIRTQERWLQWRAAAHPPAAEPPARRAGRPEQKRRVSRRPRGEGDGYSVAPRGSRSRDAISDIPGAIPAYRVWQ